jgi:CRISPR-associated protein Cmr5
MKTLEQEFADQVYLRTVAFGDQHPKGDGARDQYGSMAHKLPILIRTAGLAEALAFVESRGKEGQHALLEDLAQIVDRRNRQEFAGHSRTAEMQEYMYLTRRTILALKWFKRFAQSVLDVDATQEGAQT